MIWRHNFIVAPWVQNVLSIAMECQERIKMITRFFKELLLCSRFGLWKGSGSSEYLRAGLLRCPALSPMVAIVTIQIGPSTTAIAWTAAILAPQTIWHVGVFIAIGIHYWLDKPKRAKELNLVTILMIKWYWLCITNQSIFWIYFGCASHSSTRLLIIYVTDAGLIHSRAWIPPSTHIFLFPGLLFEILLII